MSPMKLAIGAALLALAVGIVLKVRKAQAQNADVSTYTASSMKEFKKPGETELKRKLSSEQFAVTQKCGTEPPFRNAYWDNHKPGIYVDVVLGEPLFSSLDKFDSHTGWPSFTKPLEDGNISQKTDRSLFMTR